jgi:hypothetical protein
MYCQKEVKVLLSASDYPQAQEDLGSSNSFLFYNMALLIQPMMQGVITTFKAY